MEGVSAKWREVVCSLKAGGDPITITNGNIIAIQKLILRCARQVQIPVTTRKLDRGGLRVWRIK